MSKVRKIGDLSLFDFTGTVIDQQNWVENTTTTTTSGGGGHVNQGSGHVSGPTTTTSTYSTEKLRMFLRLDSGREEEITLNDPGFGVRPGHRVSVIYAQNRADTHGRAVAAYDHSTQATKIYESAIRDLTASISLPLGCLMLMAIPSLAAMVVSGIGGSFGAMGQMSRGEQMMRDFAAHDIPGHQLDKAIPSGLSATGMPAANWGQALAIPAFIIAIVGIIIWLVRKRLKAKALQAAIIGRVRQEMKRLSESKGKSTHAQ